jgi:hypothetical protein
MKKNIANGDLTLNVKETGLTVDPVLTVTSIPSTNTFSNDKGVFPKEIKLSITGATSGTCVQSATVVATIPASSQFAFEDDEPLCLEGDEVGLPVLISGLDSGSPCSFPLTPFIEDAGQDKDVTE